MFSTRLPAVLTPNKVSEAVNEARQADRALLDLTETNPTAVGLGYPEFLPSLLADPRALTYTPLPFGLESAREAVAAGYSDVSVDRIVLTASTSEAYSLLFKLLCDPGDDVLVPLPSYPLFDLLTHLDGVRESPYRLEMAGAWCIDRDTLLRALTPRSRAILVVSPNNPTGSRLRAGDREWLVEIAREHQLAIIADEVFADYPLVPLPDATSLAGESRVLTFTLGGLSKSAGLPQMKLAWIVASGPGQIAVDAMERLALIADSYLSVSTPVQLAAPALIEAGRFIRASIQARISRNLNMLRHEVSQAPALTLCEPEGGWSVVLRVPALWPDETLVTRLLTEAGVRVHPGYFFDIEGDGFIVLSLLPPPDVFDEGVRRIVAHVAAGDVF